MNPENKKYIRDTIGKKSVAEIAGDLHLKERVVKRFLEGEKRPAMQKTPADKPPAPARIRLSLMAAVVMIVLGFILYTNSFGGKFIWDDEFLIKNNAFIKNWVYLPRLFAENIGAGGGSEYTFYRPLQMLTYMIDYTLGGLNIAFYHFTNTVLHISAALCIYWFISILSGSGLLSFLSGVLFLVHPVHTEAVTYISGRSDPLSLIFMLLSFIFYIKYLEKDNNAAIACTVIAYIAALLSREVSLIFPALVGLYHYTFKKKIRPRAFLPIVCVALSYSILRLTLLNFSHVHTHAVASLLQRSPGFFAAIAGYLRILIVPFDLHMEYGGRVFNFFDPVVVAGAAASGLLLAYAFRRRTDNPLIFFSLGWFFIALLPVSNLYPVNAYMAEHWLYMPSVGFFLFIAICLSSLSERKNLKIPAILLTIGLLGFYAYLTVKQNGYWREPVSFYERTLKYSPDSSRVYTNLCLEYSDAGRHEEAIAAGRKAVELDPDSADSYNNLGLTYKGNAEYEEAATAYKKAVELRPKDGGMYFNLGEAYKNLGKYEEAIDAYKKSLTIDPGRFYVYDNLGNSYYKLGKLQEAMDAYKRAIQINPGDEHGHNNIGSVYKSLGKNKEAIDSYKKSIECNPRFGNPYKNLAKIYYQEKRYDAAAEYYDKAVELGCEPDRELSRLIDSHR